MDHLRVIANECNYNMCHRWLKELFINRMNDEMMTAELIKKVTIIWKQWHYKWTSVQSGKGNRSTESPENNANKHSGNSDFNMIRHMKPSIRTPAINAVTPREYVSTVTWDTSPGDACPSGRGVQDTGRTTTSWRSARIPSMGVPRQRLKEWHHVDRAEHDMQKESNTSNSEFSMVRTATFNFHSIRSILFT